MIGRNNIGYTVMRAQPFHSGHKKVIDTMLSECDNVVVFLGSVQEERTKNNPFTYSERKKIIEQFYPNNEIKISPIQDLGNLTKWPMYVLTHVDAEIGNLNGSVCYYGGSNSDVEIFKEQWFDVKVVGRNDLNATSIRDILRRGLLSDIKDPIVKKYINLSHIKILKDTE